ncbi:MAG: ATP-dependent DNA helicase RecG [Gammaproteobacteria bacterium]|nr:MAG: ATP-dependent DNA helicase RecG [Gammaproteobacteria bacterium]
MTEESQDLQSIQSLKGVGPKSASLLNNLGIFTIPDAVMHLPFRYEDRSFITPIGEANYQAPVLIEGEIMKSSVVFRGRRMLFTEIYDGTGKLTMRMFNFAMAQHKALEEGKMIRCYGNITPGPNGKQMIHPQYQVFEKDVEIEIEENLTPIYPTTSGLQQNKLKKIIEDSLRFCEEHNLLKENLNTGNYSEFGNLLETLKFLHKPPVNTDIEELIEGKHPAQKSLIKEELIAHMLCAGILKNELEGRTGPSMGNESEEENRFLDTLPFDLTNAQKRSWEEIRNDLTDVKPMRRLLQGDVGSGKTLIAALSALHSHSNNWQTAFLCPTEILAEQHFNSFQAWFNELGLKTELLTGSTKAKERKLIVKELALGEIDILIGTHAIFQSGVEFKRLGLTIIDEQHRFGVHQRFSMLEKGGRQNSSPHQLIMTATPIPRTLAMTVYGSLETSIIDELPPGRNPVQTSSRPDSLRDRVIKRVEEVCLTGKRAYWVCTLIEDSDELEAQSAEELFKEISNSLPKLKVGLVHGRLKKEDKDFVIKKFREGDIQLLVCTTVIEVGVDIPEATLMIIENPERLGLSQLHQLRGRVGRKANTDSHCLLLYKEPLSGMAEERIKTMELTNDGFKIAEKDLELRGAGDIYGIRQSGLMDLKIANPIRDSELLVEAQTEALELGKNEKEFAKILVKRWISNRVDYSES